MKMQNAEDLDTDDTTSSYVHHQQEQQLYPSQSAPKTIHQIPKIPSQPITIPSVSSSSVQPSIKLNNNMEKIQYSLINTWIENGFIENMRGQVRCQLIKELKNPFKHQQDGGLQKLESTNHLSLDRRILNSIIIDYLSKFEYNYSLSIFKSEIGGELIGSLSLSDTYNQLNMNKSTDCILEQLKNENNALDKSSHYESNDKENELAMEQKRLDTLRNDLEIEIAAARNDAKFEFESALKEERCTVKKLQNELKQQMNLIQMSECEKFKTLRSELSNANETINSLQNELKKADVIESEQWKIKYQDLNKEFLNALNRENDLQCLMDEERIKLKSAKREIKYLEQLVTQNDDKSNNQTLTVSHNTKQSNDDPMHKDAVTDNAENICSVQSTAQRQNNTECVAVQMDETNNALLNKYEKLELDLKKRLKIQAILETDTRKLTYHTKRFFDQLNQQKSQTTQIINKLHNSTPKFEQRFTPNAQMKESDYLIELNAEKKEEFEVQRKKNRQQYIYYNLDKLRHERNEIQSQIRAKSIPKSIGSEKKMVTENIKIDDKKPETDCLEQKECEQEESEMEISADDQDEEEIINAPDKREEKNDDNEEKKKKGKESLDVLHTDPRLFLDAKSKSEKRENSHSSVSKRTSESSSFNGSEVEKESEKLIDDASKSDGEEQQSVIDWNVKERLEREQIEKDLMQDYTQSESFSGIDCVQSDFLQQYQKHIENMCNS